MSLCSKNFFEAKNKVFLTLSKQRIESPCDMIEVLNKNMGRKSKKSESRGLGSFFEHLREETVQGVLAILFFVISVFFILSSFGIAGVVGRITFDFFHSLFGWGYFLLPILFLALSISFFRDLEKRFAGTQIFGSVILFFSSLGLIEIFTNSKGGIIGYWVSTPIIKMFDVYAGSIILTALVVISFLIAFDATLRIDFLLYLKKIFGRKVKDEEVEVKIKETAQPEKRDEEETAEEMKTPENEKDQNPIKKILGKKEDDFISYKAKTLSMKEFTPPPLSLLERDRGTPGVGDIKANANIIKRTLQNFGIAVEMDEVSIGPSVTRYALKPAEGVKLSKILGLQNNLELALAAHPVRIEAPIPGKSLVGIEMPNSTKTTVGLGTLLAENEFKTSDKELFMALGKDISGTTRFANMAKMPHLLIAGATGSGKSVTIHSLITSLLFRNPPENLKFIMIDPKRVELTLYNNIPHLLTPVITDAKKAILALKWCAKEMDRRYNVLEEHSVRDVESYHKNILEPELKKMTGNGGNPEDLPETMPYFVIIIDELADIMQAYPRELESAIVRLAQMSRAVGIHLVLSTQRPSVNVITGLIKANIPSRIALQVASQVDSRTILDMAGAEKLLGAGDMLYMSGEMSKPQRIQSAFISENEVKKVVKYLIQNYESEIPNEIDFTQDSSKNSLFESNFDDEDSDDLYEEAREEVMRAGKASTSYLQRKLGVGYARAARLMDMLEERGVVGPGSGSKPREVLMGGESNTGEVEEKDEDELQP